MIGKAISWHAFAFTLTPAHDESMSSVLNFDAQFFIQVGFHVLATAVIVFMLYKLLYKPVVKMLLARREHIAKDLANAQTNSESAEKLKAELDRRLADIDGERETLIEEARKTAHVRAEEIINDARREAELIHKRAETDIERERAKAEDGIRRQIVEVSALLAAKYISQAIDKATQEKLLDEVIAGLGDLEWSA